MGTLHEDVFTCTMPRGILHRIRKFSVKFLLIIKTQNSGSSIFPKSNILLDNV